MSIHSPSSHNSTDYSLEESWRYAGDEAELVRAFMKMQMNAVRSASSVDEQITDYIDATERRFNGIWNAAESYETDSDQRPHTVDA